MTNPALTVEPVNVRTRIPQAAIDSVVEQIVAQFSPQKIILFGSYAAGDPKPSSDVDLLVIMETDSESQQAAAVYQQIEYRFGLDILVFTPQNLSRRVSLGDSFLRTILETGKILYESPDA